MSPPGEGGARSPLPGGPAVRAEQVHASGITASGDSCPLIRAERPRRQVPDGTLSA